MKHKILILLLFLSTLSFGQNKNKILTLGTFHFHLVKSQFGVDFDINSPDNQKQIQEIIKEIEIYNPTKIFVEWEFTKQNELDDLYNIYLKDNSFNLIKNKYGKNETKNFESEIQQLGFKIAGKLGHKKLFAFDYILNEQTDTIMAAIQKENQTDLLNEIQKDFGEYGQSIISKFQKKESIKNLLKFFNSKEFENKLNSGYISLFNKVGSLDDFSGAYFVSERFRRNLYMYSLIQKQIKKTDERILVIVGGQHSAGFKDFIRNDKNFEQLDLENVLK